VEQTEAHRVRDVRDRFRHSRQIPVCFYFSHMGRGDREVPGIPRAPFWVSKKWAKRETSGANSASRDGRRVRRFFALGTRMEPAHGNRKIVGKF